MGLIFAFEAFNNEKENISKKIALKLDKNALILPVTFDSAWVLRQIKARKPSRIIGIGRCRRGGLVRIERKVTNIIEENGRNLRKLSACGPEVYFSTLKTMPVAGARLSYDAGEYAGNFMLYSVLEFVAKNKICAEAGFFHVPMAMDLDDAVRVIKSILE